MRMRGTVRLCDQNGCGFRWRECPTHAPIVVAREDAAFTTAIELENRKCCGYIVHSPTCERSKPSLPQRADPFSTDQCRHRQCPTCGYTADGLAGIADCETYKDLCGLHAAHRAAWLAKQQPSVSAGWHTIFEGFERDDKRAAVTDAGGVWAMHIPQHTILEFLTAESAMAYADAQLAQEDARKAEDRSEPPEGWFVSEYMLNTWHVGVVGGKPRHGCCAGRCNCYELGGQCAGTALYAKTREHAVADAWARYDLERAR